MIFMDVDAALSGVPVNVMPLLSDSDFKTRQTAVAFNAAGMDLVWNFVTPNGSFTQTAVTPTSGGDYDWTHQGDGMYTIEIPASGGASINNDTEGFGWFTGVATGVLPWRGPIIGFRAAGLNDKLIESAYETTRGLAGTALPNAAAEASGGLFTRGTGAGQIAQTINGTIHADVQGILGTAVGPEGGAGRLAAAFTTFLNVASPVFTAASVNQTGDAYGVVNSGSHGNSALKTLIDAIKAITDALGATAAGRLAVSAGQMLPGTVDDTGFTPTTGEFEADDITEATPDHFNGRVILFTSGALQYQVCVITDYSLVGGRGHFTVAAYGGGVLTDAPANDSTFLIV